MKKKLIISILIVSAVALFIIIRLNLPEASRDTIRGTFQTKLDQKDSLLVQLTFESEDNSFVQYHDGTLVDKGTYEKTKDNIYLLKSDLQDTYIILQKDNSFFYYNTILPDARIIEMDLRLTAPLYIDQTNF